MKKIACLFFTLLPFILSAQVNLKNIRQKSHQAFAFKISALDAEKFIKEDSIRVDKFENSEAAEVFHKDSINEEVLPLGHYVLISADGPELVASLIEISNLIVYPINNKFNIQLNIREKDGRFINDAEAWINNKKASYHPESNSYWARQKRIKEGFVRVHTPTDTCFFQLEEDMGYTPTPLKQRWVYFKNTKSGRVITWLPNKIRSLGRYHARRYSPDRHSGYVLLNQPKYKLTDTVKLKAYIVNNKGKRYEKKLDVLLEYRFMNQSRRQLLETISPTSPGSYLYSFPLSDTLPSDLRYRIMLNDKKGRHLISKQFSTEDYLLDEIASYHFRSNKESYYRHDSLFFYASAKDANDLPLLDGKLSLLLLTRSIDCFREDVVQVPDTLYAKEIILEAEGETVFGLSADIFPQADIKVDAKLIFKNSNNEIHEENLLVNYSASAAELVVTTIADTIIAEYKILGKSVKSKGSVDISGDRIDKTLPVDFPIKMKIDPLAENYRFEVYHLNDTIAAPATIPDNYRLRFSRNNNEDTLGFSLHNPHKIPVNFIILDGNKLIYSGREEQELITWRRIMNKNKIYQLKWQYIWAGRHHEGSENLAVLHKLLKVNIDNSETIYPGQKDTITIEIKDYKDNPVKGVNLAAVAYNSQFKKDINVPEPPYLVNYRKRPSIIRGKHEEDNVYLVKKYALNDHRKWISRLSLDSMPFYQISFPSKSPYTIATPIAEFLPQLSVHVVKNGRPQKIFLLYINRQLTYYSEVTDHMPYSFETIESYTQLGIRLFDRFIEIDSIYVQPFYKHDIVLDLDLLPPGTISHTKPVFWTPGEKKSIEESMWQLGNDSRTNEGYVWQNQKLVKISSARRHLIGPFTTRDSLHYYKPGNFDIRFPFEPGYEYNLFPQLVRLEKTSIFPKTSVNVKLALPKQHFFTLGDTIAAPPKISYLKKIDILGLRLTPYEKSSKYIQSGPAHGKAAIKFETAPDTLLKYVVLYHPDTLYTNLILDGSLREIHNIEPGSYHLLLVSHDHKVAELKELDLRAGYTLCLQTRHIHYQQNNRLFEELISEAYPVSTIAKGEKFKKESSLPLPPAEKGNGHIRGRVVDKEGNNGIPGVSIYIDKTATGVLTSADGYFQISNIKEGRYSLNISSIGYDSKKIQTNVESGIETFLNISMTLSNAQLDEVVVVGYGVSRQKNLTGSVSVGTIEGKPLTSELASTLQGNVASVAVSQGNDYRLLIRGSNSITGNENPIYVIDGILYDQIPPGIQPGMIEHAEVLKGTSAVVLYGSRAINGVIIITTGAKTMRNSFRDYAFWQPELFSDKAGRVSFEAIYPDNITGWEIYVLGMDKNKRIGKSIGFTNAYKPVMAQLNGPQFLIDGDSVYIVGKALNYTEDSYSIKTEFSANGQLKMQKDSQLAPKASQIYYLPAKASQTGTFNAAFSLKTSTGFADGEERKIPVFDMGTEESKGAFYVLSKDTSLNFLSIAEAGPLEIYAQNNTLDLFLKELDHLQEYPYYCMEQTASKLKGLLLEKRIREYLNQPFKREKQINALIKKLQNGQMFNGSWGWWENGATSVPITAYIVEALLPLRQDPLIESSIRNGLLSLQYQLANADTEKLLQILSCFSKANHQIDYQPYLSKISFDSLTNHQQWQWVQICQQQKISHDRELKRLVKTQKSVITGGIYWGTETYRWYNNIMSTTLLAYTVLEQDIKYQHLSDKLIQFFLERRQSFWVNTVESASIVAAILPRMLSNNRSVNQPSIITVKGDTSFVIDSFPFSAALLDGKSRELTIQKSGGGISYLTLYQKWWNRKPDAVIDQFAIETYFEQNGIKSSSIKSGEKLKMKVRLQVLSESEYVMIEVPIPAGCNYAVKPQDGSQIHKEFLKNKIVLFAEFLRPGEHVFDIDLEPRYRGTFTLNPAKAQLMYFPTFYGRNNMRKMEIN